MSKYFAQFDGVDVDGKRHGYGEEVDTADLHPAVVSVLIQQGQISSNSPVASVVVMGEGTTKVEDMSRADLQREATELFTAQFRKEVENASTETLRGMVDHGREKAREDNAADDDKGAGDGSVGGTPYADLKDKPLGGLKTADLDTIAREEGVSFDGAKSNADRVAAIEAARKAKS